MDNRVSLGKRERKKDIKMRERKRERERERERERGRERERKKEARRESPCCCRNIKIFLIRVRSRLPCFFNPCRLFAGFLLTR